jgi:peptidoglycan/xylan/chitin deacetylase (PgdA/CDA1 family)
LISTLLALLAVLKNVRALNAPDGTPYPGRNPTSKPEWVKYYQNLGDRATVYESCNDRNTWALTYDDGPSTQFTPALLDYLDQQNVKATFFVIGLNIVQSQASMDLVKRAYNAGHQIAVHTWTHPYV